MPDSWSLIVDRRLAEAVTAYSAELDACETSFSHRNRATALLLMGRLVDAFHDIQLAEALEPQPKRPGYLHSDGDQVRLGVIEWLSNQQQEAGNRWFLVGQALLRGRVSYSDASGGMGTASILRFAGARLGRSDIRAIADMLIAKIVKRPRYRSWPLPIGGLYLGHLSPEEALSSASEVPILRDRELCQGHFAVAVTRLEASDAAGYTRHMHTAASYSRAIHEDEFFLATHESGPGGGA